MTIKEQIEYAARMAVDRGVSIDVAVAIIADEYKEAFEDAYMAQQISTK